MCACVRVSVCMHDVHLCVHVCARVCVYPCVSIENQAVEFYLPTSFLLPAAGTDNVTI